jgi:hypothetical protein
LSLKFLDLVDLVHTEHVSSLQDDILQGSAPRFSWVFLTIFPSISGRSFRPFSPYHKDANAHRGKVRKANRVPVVLGLIEENPAPLTSKSWAEMIRKVYEVDPMICPRCGGRMRAVPGRRISSS